MTPTEARTMTIQCVKRTPRYDFYQLSHAGETYWNIVPAGSRPPEGGYASQTWIEQVKGVTFND